ncbi:helix-turn-helix domain-containing protein [Nocardia sp. NPDC059091]|uniref:helix-turn-helix domain-containing protein n=1 Tax=unclassified Nocardia TaxID=2637762 RepID=UPI0036C71C7C
MSGSTLAARALGRLLAEYRQRAHVTRSAAARLVDTSIQTIGRLEDGLKGKVSRLWINVLADAYKCSDDERRLLLGLAQEMVSAQKNWWRAYADEMNPGLHHYLALEGAARRLVTWRVTMIPGLLQTPEYRRAIAWTENPEMPTGQLEKRIEMNARRQNRLNDDGFGMDVILSEMVLRDRIGGEAVMADQLQRLVDLSMLDRISIRAVTFDTPGHLGSMVGSFALLEFPKLPATGMVEPPVVYVEGYAGDLYLEREGEVTRYRAAFKEISRVALDPDTSRQLMLSIAKEFRA